eukprot:GFUD01010699.1.p1 GENE.GFUD01010699.1~~GFUD01010699.1.p1  ORF type:complete len:1137 (+),score=277.74 GFUD01010699.1:243-3413(+)
MLSTQAKVTHLTPLLLATRSNSSAVVGLLVNEPGVTLDAQDSQGCTAVFTAVTKGLGSLLQILGEAGADLNIPDNTGSSPLYEAVVLGQEDSVKRLLYIGASIQTGQNSTEQVLHGDSLRDAFVQVTPLYAAAETGQSAILSLLITAGADVNTTIQTTRHFDITVNADYGSFFGLPKNTHMCTPLHAAVNNQHTETVKILLEAEAGVKYPDWWYNYPLHLASRNGDREIVELLVAAGTDLDQDSRIRGEFTHVYVAAKDGHSDIVRLLHSARANLSLTDSAPLNSALHIASVRGHIKTVETLLELGVDVNGPTGQTALYEALVSGFNGSATSNIETVRFLADHGALLNMTTEYGQGLIFQVIINTGNLDFVKFIIETGEIDINKNGKDVVPSRYWFYWYSPLTFAVRKGELQIVKYLVSVGADVNHDSYPLKIAMEKWPTNTKCDNKMLGIVETLLLHGAVDQTPDSRKNLLSLAAQTGCLTLVKLFVEYGADVRNSNALLYAETLPIAKYLVENGANSNQTAEDGKNAVYEAAFRDKAEILKYFVESGAEINLKKQSVLFAAAKNWRYGEFGLTLETVKTVLSHGGEIQFGSKNGERILTDQQMAHYFSNMEIIKVLLKYEAVDVNVRTREGRTPLMFAAKLNSSKNLAIVKYLVSVGADVDAVDQDGETVIHRLIRNPSDSRAWARDWEFPKILDYLVNIARAPLNTPNKLGVFPVQLAINRRRNPNYVKQLITLGAWVNITTENGDNLLHLAAAKGGLEAMKTFIENGVDVNSRNMKGETPLFHVFGDIERVKLLVDAGADVNITNNEGTSVVFLAGELILFNSHGWETVKYLVESGAALVLNTTEGPRSLLYELAATKDRHNCYVCLEDLLKTLVAQGADIDYLGPSGLTALHQVVLQLSSTGKVSTLLNVGADIDAISKDGRTPLIYAVMEQAPGFVQFLIREGGDVNIKDFGNKNAFSYAIASHNEIVKVLSTKKRKIWGILRLFKILKYLEEGGLDVSDVDSTGKSVLSVAKNEDQFLAVLEYFKIFSDLNIEDGNLRGMIKDNVDFYS